MHQSRTAAPIRHHQIRSAVGAVAQGVVHSVAGFRHSEAEVVRLVVEAVRLVEVRLVVVEAVEVRLAAGVEEHRHLVVVAVAAAGNPRNVSDDTGFVSGQALAARVWISMTVG